MSNYVHWAGANDETVGSWDWIAEGIGRVREACEYIWRNQTEKDTGMMLPQDMHPEIVALWERFKRGDIGTDEVKISSRLLDGFLN